MSHLDPYNASGWTTLHSLVQSLARPFADTGQPNNPAANSQREEPTFPPDPRVTAAGESAVDTALDKEMTNQWVQRMKEARDKKAAPARADKAATQAWIDKMRAAREGKKAVADALSKPPPRGLGSGQLPSAEDQLKGQKPWTAEDEARTYPVAPPTEAGLGVDPSQAGEDAVAKALRDIDMKPLIDHALLVQEAMRRRDAIRQMIESMQTPQLPESQIPENTNRPPGMEHSEVTAHDYSLRPPLAPGVEGIGMPPLRPPPMPPPANMPLFPPQGPHDPNLPPGPHVRSPGKPEDEPPVTE